VKNESPARKLHDENTGPENVSCGLSQPLRERLRRLCSLRGMGAAPMIRHLILAELLRAERAGLLDG
jgi:hypothetical protein